MLSCLAMVPLSGCGRADGDQQILRVAGQRGGTRAMMTAAGELDHLPYKVEWSEFPSAPPQIEAISAGAVDVGAASANAFLFAYGSNPELRAVQALSGGDNQQVAAVVVPNGSSIRTGRDLRGKRIGTTRGTAGHSVLLQALEQAGLKPEDVKISFLTPSEGLTAFRNGDLDALAIWIPYLAMAVLHQKARVLTYANTGNTAYMFQISTKSSLKAKRDLIADFTRRYGRAQSWANKHSREWAQILVRETNVPPDVAAYTAERLRWTPVPIDDKVIETQKITVRRFHITGRNGQGIDLAAGFDAVESR
ncbi:ABC transporter substrate-binding protein [Sphingobium sp. 22B]|nr:ABC transporter substrate-binding protein [Sphingobium sp. AM]KYC32760.1 ABC transporter substrate-binding protein [Sphingobium sp. 22B]OAP31650.1 ABC transporter substrate-binding protein [Sphingobium sp. 20006FA]